MFPCGYDKTVRFWVRVMFNRVSASVKGTGVREREGGEGGRERVRRERAKEGGRERGSERERRGRERWSE